MAMTEQQYNELLCALGKQALAELIKNDIRQRISEPYASIYCKQFDDAKQLADFLEYVAKQMKGQ